MIVGVDLDHTLTDAAWRDEHIEACKASGKWDPYHSLAIQDKPTSIVPLVIALIFDGHEVYIVTARPRKWLRQTHSWLHTNGIIVDQDHILMRAQDSFLPAPEIKLELIANIKLDLFIDDRDDVIAAMGELGITTLQARVAT